MLNYIQENIDNAQELAKQKLSTLLEKNGYLLESDIHNINGIETRIFQWIDPSKKHCVQLIWDGKEQWFDLGEFEYDGNLNYTLATNIKLFPFHITKRFNRKNYIEKIIDSIIVELSDKINITQV